MDNLLIISTLIPLIGVNLWHTILLFDKSRNSRPLTISERAASDESLLTRHRVVHSLASLMFIVFSIIYLIPSGYALAGAALIIAAVFDISQVVTLNRKSATAIYPVNSHAVAAWIMALGYLSYASVITLNSGLSQWTVVAIWILLSLLLVNSVVRRFKNFWITQHVYFCFVAIIISGAHIMLMK